MHKRILVFTALLAAAHTLFAEEPAVIVVSGSKIEENEATAVEKVQVITGEEIEKSGAKNLAEAVKGIPGIAVGGHPADSISMQGFDSDYVKIMIDGIAVSGDIGGAVAVQQIPVEDIDHIEIVRGASSALYGSDAMGGVVNIITKKNKAKKDEKLKAHGRLVEEFSSNIRNYSAAHIAFTRGGFSAGASGSFDWTHGKTEERNTALAGRVNRYLSPFMQLGFVRANVDYAGSGGKVGSSFLFSDARQKANTTPYEQIKYQSSRLEGALTGEKAIADTLILSGFATVKSYLLDTEFENKIYRSNRETDASSIDSENEVRLTWEPNFTHTALAGFNGNFQTMDGDAFETRKKQLLLSFFTQDTINIGALDVFFIVPGVRLDVSPPLDGTPPLFQCTPKLSMRYNPFEQTAFRFSYGMGYKTPSLKQKHWIFIHGYTGGEGNFILYGNPNLKPETSHGFNAGVEQRIGSGIKISAAGYFNYVHNLIDNKITGSKGIYYTRTYVNIDKAITYGGDASLSISGIRFGAKASYAYTGAKEFSRSKETWQDLPLRLPHAVSVSGFYMIPVIETRINASAEWHSPSLISAEDHTFSSDYLMFSAGIEKKLWRDRIELYGRVDNMLNNAHFVKSSAGQTQKEYFELNDGIVFSIGVRLNLP